MEVELFHAVEQKGGQTDVTKLIVAFRNSANTPQKCILSVSINFIA
jgi:hypothetical protein